MVSATAERKIHGFPCSVIRAAVEATMICGDFIKERHPGIKRIGSIYVNDDFGKGGLTAFTNRAKQVGIQVVVDEKYTRGDVDFTVQITKLRAANVDGILDWSRYHEAALIAKQIRQMGLRTPIFGSDGNAHPKYIELGGDAVEGAYYATHFSPATSGHLPVAQRLIQKLKAKHAKEPDFVHSEAYDAMLVVADAIKRAGNLDRQKIRDAMAATDIDGTRGRIRFDKNGDPTFTTHVVRVVGGKETDARKSRRQRAPGLPERAEEPPVPKETIRVPDIPQPLANYTPATRTGNLVFAAGQVATDFRTDVALEARIDPAFPYYGSAIKKQTRYILENLQRTFKAAGTSLDRVVKAQVFHTDLANFNGFDEVWKEFFRTPPPRTTIGTTGLLIPGCLVEIDLIATTDAAPGKVVRSDAPQPLASYSEAVVVGDLVFAAGQLASDFKTGVPREARVDPAFPYYGSDIKRQTRYVLENLQRTFKAAGTSLDRVVKAQVFHTDLANFDGFDEVWREFFPSPPPRTTIGTTGLLVKDTLVEIDLIAALPTTRVEAIQVADIPRPLAHYTAAVRAGNFVFAAGQLASDFRTGVPREARVDPAFPYYGSDIKRQTRYVLENLQKTFKAAGTSLDHVVKAQVFHTDLANFNGFDEVWKEFFPTPPPRSTVGTTGLLVRDTLVEIDLIAVMP